MTNDIPTNAVVVRDDVEAVMDAVRTPSQPLTTPAQAKIDAVASLTMAAYQKASQLTLTAEEIARLKADFPDDAFKPGAAGKEQLIYCEHAFLRDRLDEVLGMGQWALVPRNRWAEPFKTAAGKDGSRVYFEGMLMVRGCFVSEAIGEMEYYPHNASQNYGDAVEGAESACLRRCCKKWGIGLQAWKKDWCEGWWQRKRSGKRPESTAAPATSPVQPPQKKSNPLPEVLKEAKARFIENVRKEGKLFDAWVYLVETGTILETEQIEDARVEVLFPSVKEDMETDAAKPLLKTDYDRMMGDIRAHTILESQHGDWQEKFTHAYNENKKKPQKKVEVPRDQDSALAGEQWRNFPVPFGKDAGTALEEIDKKTLYGWWANFEPKEFKGKIKESDVKFREMLDLAGEHYSFTTK